MKTGAFRASHFESGRKFFVSPRQVQPLPLNSAERKTSPLKLCGALSPSFSSARIREKSPRPSPQKLRSPPPTSNVEDALNQQQLMMRTSCPKFPLLKTKKEAHAFSGLEPIRLAMTSRHWDVAKSSQFVSKTNLYNPGLFTGRRMNEVIEEKKKVKMVLGPNNRAISCLV